MSASGAEKKGKDEKQKKILQIFPKDAFEMRSFDSRTKFKLELNKKYSLWEKSYTLMMWIRPTFTEMHLKDPASIMGLCSMGCWPEQNGPFVHFMFKGENLLHSHFGQGNTSSGIRFGNGEWMHVAFVYDHAERMQHIYVNGKQISKGSPVKLLKAPHKSKYTKEWFLDESTAHLGECKFIGHENMHTKFRGEMFGAQMYVNVAYTAEEVKIKTLPFPESKIHNIIFSPPLNVPENDLPSHKKAMSEILSQAASDAAKKLEKEKKEMESNKRRYLSSLGVLTKEFVALLKQSPDFLLDLNAAASTLTVGSSLFLSLISPDIGNNNNNTNYRYRNVESMT